jgi:predicted nuclease of predicted toxin-antitoxin system
MRLLLDENVPRKLKQDLQGYDVYTVRELRQNGNEDEDVLQFLIAFNFDALITCDKNLRFQQNLTRYPTPVIVLDTYTNAYPILKSTIPNLLKALKSSLPPGATIVKPL